MIRKDSSEVYFYPDRIPAIRKLGIIILVCMAIAQRE